MGQWGGLAGPCRIVSIFFFFFGEEQLNGGLQSTDQNPRGETRGASEKTCCGGMEHCYRTVSCGVAQKHGVRRKKVVPKTG